MTQHDKIGIGSFKKIRDHQLIKEHLILQPLTCAVLYVPSFQRWGYHVSNKIGKVLVLRFHFCFSGLIDVLFFLRMGCMKDPTRVKWNLLR